MLCPVWQPRSKFPISEVFGDHCKICPDWACSTGPGLSAEGPRHVEVCRVCLLDTDADPAVRAGAWVPMFLTSDATLTGPPKLNLSCRALQLWFSTFAGLLETLGNHWKIPLRGFCSKFKFTWFNWSRVWPGQQFPKLLRWTYCPVVIKTLP